jgi:hypothetical protein
VATTTARSVARIAAGGRTGSSRSLTPGDLAWIAAPPCALALYLAIVDLGPRLGAALFPEPRIEFWPSEVPWPEPVEHARFLMAIAAPFVAAALVVLLAERIRLPRPLARLAVGAAELGLLAFALFTLVAQHTLAYTGLLAQLPQHRVFFTDPTLVVAAIVAALLVVLAHSERLGRRLAVLLRETPRKRTIAVAVAIGAVALWMLTTFNTEGSIGRTPLAVRGNIPFWLDEPFAVLDGRAPLVDFHAQYGQLWPYLSAAVMALLGTTFSVYAATMVAGTTAAVLAIFATLRRVVRSSLGALALFLPVLATGFFMEQGTMANRYGPSNLFSLFPIRYSGPYALAWLVARHLGGARPRRAWPLFVLAGLVVVNNTEFGTPALAATVVALAAAAPRPLWPALRRLAGEAAAGLLGALALHVLLTLLLAGALPHYGYLSEFTRLYAIGGFGMIPMPAWGFHLAVYLTFAGALLVATTRAVARRRDVLLTGMLGWIGVFGLGALGYYAGRSVPDVLIDVFSPWALALALLLVVALRGIARRPARWPTAAELAVFLGFGLAVCSLAQTPAPWTQLSRLATVRPVPLYRYEPAQRFIRRWTHPGERVAIIAPLGHRLAYDLGLDNIAPYANIESMPAAEQWKATNRLYWEHHIHKLFLLRTPMDQIGEAPHQEGQIRGEELAYLQITGWKVVRRDVASGLWLLRPGRPLSIRQIRALNRRRGG